MSFPVAEHRRITGPGQGFGHQETITFENLMDPGIFTSLALTLLGLLSLFFGAEVLIKGASRLALWLGIKPVIVGLTIVAFGTSAPEAIVSIFAAFEGQPDIAVGNVVGSNIFNIAFILGLSALVRPLKVDSLSLRREMPFVVGSAVLLGLTGRDGFLGRVDGMILLSVFALFLWFCFLNKNADVERGSQPQDQGRGSGTWLQTGGGLFLLVLGAKLFLTGSVGMARAFGISELLIGLTLVAAGTSLPELATSVIAAFRKQDDISIGNISGSNIFNILFILGLAALVHPIAIDLPFITRDIPLMIFLSLVMLPIMKTGFVISRPEGAFLVLCYIGYMLLLVQPSR